MQLPGGREANGNSFYSNLFSCYINHQIKIKRRKKEERRKLD